MEAQVIEQRLARDSKIMGDLTQKDIIVEGNGTQQNDQMKNANSTRSTNPSNVNTYISAPVAAVPQNGQNDLNMNKVGISIGAQQSQQQNAVQAPKTPITTMSSQNIQTQPMTNSTTKSPRLMPVANNNGIPVQVAEKKGRFRILKEVPPINSTNTGTVNGNVSTGTSHSQVRQLSDSLQQGSNQADDGSLATMDSGRLIQNQQLQHSMSSGNVQQNNAINDVAINGTRTTASLPNSRIMQSQNAMIHQQNNLPNKQNVQGSPNEVKTKGRFLVIKAKDASKAAVNGNHHRSQSLGNAVESFQQFSLNGVPSYQGHVPMTPQQMPQIPMHQQPIPNQGTVVPNVLPIPPHPLQVNIPVDVNAQGPPITHVRAPSFQSLDSTSTPVGMNPIIAQNMQCNIQGESNLQHPLSVPMVPNPHLQPHGMSPMQHQMNGNINPHAQSKPPKVPKQVTTTAAGVERINASSGISQKGGLSSAVPGGLGKMFHFLTQLKNEVVEADNLIKSLQSDNKFLVSKKTDINPYDRSQSKILTRFLSISHDSEERIKSWRRSIKNLKQGIWRKKKLEKIVKR